MSYQTGGNVNARGPPSRQQIHSIAGSTERAVIEGFPVSARFHVCGAGATIPTHLNDKEIIPWKSSRTITNR